jgi:hypothetical protein
MMMMMMMMMMMNSFKSVSSELYNSGYKINDIVANDLNGSIGIYDNISDQCWDIFYIPITSRVVNSNILMLDTILDLW